MNNGAPVTWPCGPIGYRVVLENAPAGVRDLVSDATARVSAVSGYQFREDPSLRYVYEREIPYGGITIAWLPRDQFPVGDADDIGYGGANWNGTKYRSGEVSILTDWSGSQRADFSASAAGPVLLHEIGHALGLGHIEDSKAVMFPVNQGVSVFTPAERNGLRYLRQRCG